MLNERSYFDSLDPVQQKILLSCMGSTKVFSATMFPERFYRPFSTLHEQIFSLLDDDSKQRVVIAAPRGWGKTTTMTVSYPAKRICFRQNKYVVPISATATSAEMQGENLKAELVSNLNLKHFFGGMESKKFSKEQWITSTGTMVMPRGAGQQVRGLLYDRFRPDLIVVDDLETSEGVRSEEQREKLLNWFFEDVCNSVNLDSPTWKIVVIGTVLHEDSLLVRLLEDPNWHSVVLSVCDDELHSNWPDYLSDADVKRIYEDHRQKGKLDSFAREFRNIPISKEDATFKQEYFKYYEELKLAENKDVFNVVIVDPAKTVKLHSAESAVVGVGVSRAGRAVYFRDCVADKLYPDQLYDAMFDMVKRLRARILAVEVTSLNEFIVQPIKNEMRRRGIYPIFMELKARGKKEERIASLVPFYRQGFIYHNPQCSTALENQLTVFPRAKRWDVMDAFAYIVEVLELDNQYFECDEDEDPDKEFDELKDEDVLAWSRWV